MPSPDAKRPAPKTMTFAGSAGTLIAVDAAGPIDGVPVVLLHGGGQTRHAWGAAATLLAGRGFRAYAMDLRGHGDSAWSATGAYNIEAYCDDLRILLRDAGQPAILVGASLGGIACLLAAGEAPFATILGLVLVDVSAKMREAGTEAIVNFMRGTMNGFAALDDAAQAIARYLPGRKKPRTTDGLHKNLRQRDDGRYYWHWDPRTLDNRIGRGTVDRRMQDAAAHLDVPCLLLRGTESDLVPRDVADEFIRHFADGQVVDIPKAHHMVAGDENSLFNQELLNFAADLRDRQQ